MRYKIFPVREIDELVIGAHLLHFENIKTMKSNYDNQSESLSYIVNIILMERPSLPLGRLIFEAEHPNGEELGQACEMV